MTGVVTPLGVIYGEPLPLLAPIGGEDSSPRDTYGVGGRPALREPCHPGAAGCVARVCLAQGKVILATSAFRR